MKNNVRLLLIVLGSVLVTSFTQRISAASQESEKEAILAVITRMEAAWNRGDFRGYMEGFANPDVIFVSRGEFQKDWQGTLDHYIRDYGASEATRGRLRFFDIRIELLAADTAQLISRYQLDRPQNPQDGINTRLMRKRGDKWVIALNHVSSREVTSSSAAPATADALHVERFGTYLRVADLDRARAFYERVFGKKPYVANDRLVGFDVAGALLALYVNRDEQVARGRNVVPYLRVTDADAELARLARLNVELLDDKVVVEGPIKLFRFADPDGNVLEIFSLVTSR